MKLRNHLASFLFALICFQSAAAASYISLNTTLSSRVEEGGLKITVASINKGDESAFNVQAEIRVEEKTLLAEKRTELGIGAKYQAGLILPLALKKPGTYPLVLIMHYTDANQYPFSALTGQVFVHQQEAIPPVFGQLKPAVFSREGKIRFSLKNLSETKLKTSTYLVAPRELTVAEKSRAIELEPKSERGSSFSVKNFSALAGSTYQVFAFSEFEDQHLHYTAVFPGTIKIVAAQEIFGLSYTTLFVMLAVLAVVFISAQFLKGRA